jgi:hypothetical protein
MVQQQSLTNLHAGLSLVNETVFDPTDLRPVSVPRILVIFTDGVTNAGISPLPVADTLRNDKDVSIYAFGVGDEVNLADLVGVTGSADRVTLASDFTALQSLAGQLTSDICIEPGQDCYGAFDPVSCVASNCTDPSELGLLNCPVTCGTCFGCDTADNGACRTSLLDCATVPGAADLCPGRCDNCPVAAPALGGEARAEARPASLVTVVVAIAACSATMVLAALIYTRRRRQPTMYENGTHYYPKNAHVEPSIQGRLPLPVSRAHFYPGGVHVDPTIESSLSMTNCAAHFYPENAHTDTGEDWHMDPPLQSSDATTVQSSISRHFYPASSFPFGSA